MRWQPTTITKIDDLSADDHYHITSDDACYFIGEYTARALAGHSDTNQFVMNYKKNITRRAEAHYRYKGIAIRDAGEALNRVIAQDSLNNLTFIPVPPSKTSTHLAFDNRLVQTLEHLSGLCPQCDYQNIISQNCDLTTSHLVGDTGERPNIDTLFDAYQLVDPLPPVRGTLAIFDDMLTTGAHFVAMRRKLREVFPNHPIIGIFLTRRAIPHPPANPSI